MATNRRCFLENLESRVLLAADTFTGLDSLVELIQDDPGLNYRIPTSEIDTATDAANSMNHKIVEAIYQTGVANDGVFDEFDLYAMNQYLQDVYSEEWVLLHGDDTETDETGFHLVQNDGASTRLFGGLNAVNTVADGVYHMGFDIVSGRFLNEDGNRNASVLSVAHWLNQLLEDDLATQSDKLYNPDFEADQDAIDEARFYSLEELVMDEPDDYVEVVHTDSLALANGTVALTFVADDVSGRRTLFSKDARDYGEGGHLTAFLRDGRIEVRLQNTEQSVYLTSRSEFLRAGEEHHVAVSFGSEGFQLYVDGQLEGWRPDFMTGIDTNTNNLAIGANTWARHAGKPDWTADYFDGTILDFGIYDRALTRAEVLALGGDVHEDEGSEYSTSDTGLDRLVDLIIDDMGLNRRISQEEIVMAAKSADWMNLAIKEAIIATGVANNDALNAADVRDINTYIRDTYADEWVVYHGDDEGDRGNWIPSGAE